MPKRQDIQSILIIGAGPIVIGQACEFDYSGTQACRALRAEGYRIVLVNSNPATIMTDPGLADATYIEPITPDFVAQVIAREKPDALLATMGGQTALNCAIALREAGILEACNVELIGANADAIEQAENRELFRAAMSRIGLATPPARIARSVGDADRALEEVGLPAIIRPSFTLGGTGGGIARSRTDAARIVAHGIAASPSGEVLVEKSVLGWKEYELEVVRDRNDNCIIVCAIENVDPMGVHTGDSVTVAPALTLTDKEYQKMRSAAIAVLREIGVETGGSNVQFAVNPRSGEQIVIEMNPRVSRSSALASKATGFPIAKVAALLAVGYTLDELANDITGGAIPAAFEPSVDYVVTKIPRFAFEKFPDAEPVLTTTMKSVGEVMAVGRNFCQSFQKALRGLESGLCGLDRIEIPGAEGAGARAALRAALARATPDRLRVVAQALRHGMSIDEIHAACQIDPWFLGQIKTIVEAEQQVVASGLPDTADGWHDLKSLGFSDQRLAVLAGTSAHEVARQRRRRGVRPVYKRIDSCANEFFSPTAYMYSSFEPGFAGAPLCEAAPSGREKVIILGGGPNRIGQGIEFDYCCCHAAFALADLGIESIMVNCNPETVSTDYDTSDRLYFESLNDEDVLEIIHVEQARGNLLGVIAQFGGQTPLQIVPALRAANIPVLGTSPDAIDLAEDRDRFQKFLRDLRLRQPANAIARSLSACRDAAHQLGFPLVVRPSYVLGGRAMQIVRDEDALESYLSHTLARLSVAAGDMSRTGEGAERRIEAMLRANPLLFDTYLDGAVEIDVDALCDGEDVFVCAIMEHIEEAGVHSGDSACVIPPQSLPGPIVDALRIQAESLARALGVIGLVNIQFAVRDDAIYVLEVNPRASRTVPFAAKAIDLPIAKIATQIMTGRRKLRHFDLPDGTINHVCVKEAVFPFARFEDSDVVLGPEMRSTGEVMGIDADFDRAYAKSQCAAGFDIPRAGTVFISVSDEDKPRIAEAARQLAAAGFDIVASAGTERFLRGQGVALRMGSDVPDGHDGIAGAIAAGKVQLVLNTCRDVPGRSDNRALRRAAFMAKIPYYTTVRAALAAINVAGAATAGQSGKRQGVQKDSLETVRALQDYFPVRPHG